MCLSILENLGGTAGRNYSTTQACAYADAQLIAEQLRDSNSSLDMRSLYRAEKKPFLKIKSYPRLLMELQVFLKTGLKKEINSSKTP